MIEEMFRDILLAVTSSQDSRFIYQRLLPGSLSVFSGSAIKLDVTKPSGRVPGWHRVGFSSPPTQILTLTPDQKH